MKTTAANLYDFPRYYDLVFGSDWKAEFDFLLDVFDTHVTGKVRRLFEPACGTGRLVFRLAQAGYDVCGLDLNERAVEYCNQPARSPRIAAERLRGRHGRLSAFPAG